MQRHAGATARARLLRRRSTDAERLLWSKLRDRRLAGAHFRRQHPVGPFVVDFCCLDARLIIEVDGGEHSVRVRQDQNRDQFLAGRGFRVLRFWNHEVLRQTEAILQAIAAALPPHLDPLPAGERKRKGIACRQMAGRAVSNHAGRRRTTSTTDATSPLPGQGEGKGEG
ncbi:MAG TPA: endonuclease domain-containing protein [candidate division WOR-3 bacterium]|uniref:Endonuclease domain-containing protein n=1 Tax=candidate division WOR-3 bacterium TaxID=2052148 RepID=A0A7V0T6C5_UNCW3|nr:endonuclease domain-containing protein [candidate division WOR-3 bacterium]